jgi:hypothetical protein
MTGGRPVAEKYLKLMTEVKNARISNAWWLLPINALVISHRAFSGWRFGTDPLNTLKTPS